MGTYIFCCDLRAVNFKLESVVDSYVCQGNTLAGEGINDHKLHDHCVVLSQICIDGYLFRKVRNDWNWVPSGRVKNVLIDYNLQIWKGLAIGRGWVVI